MAKQKEEENRFYAGLIPGSTEQHVIDREKEIFYTTEQALAELLNGLAELTKKIG